MAGRNNNWIFVAESARVAWGRKQALLPSQVPVLFHSPGKQHVHWFSPICSAFSACFSSMITWSKLLSKFQLHLFGWLRVLSNICALSLMCPAYPLSRLSARSNPSVSHSLLLIVSPCEMSERIVVKCCVDGEVHRLSALSHFRLLSRHFGCGASLLHSRPPPSPVAPRSFSTDYLISSFNSFSNQFEHWSVVSKIRKF